VAFHGRRLVCKELLSFHSRLQVAPSTVERIVWKFTLLDMVARHKRRVACRRYHKTQYNCGRAITQIARVAAKLWCGYKNEMQGIIYEKFYMKNQPHSRFIVVAYSDAQAIQPLTKSPALHLVATAEIRSKRLAHRTISSTFLPADNSAWTPRTTRGLTLVSRHCPDCSLSNWMPWMCRLEGWLESHHHPP
jgi:hypothetical protein